jgi:hypothetical protein
MGMAQHFSRGPDGVQMHFHFDYSARQVLWTLTFASQLVLLVVLLGRDRARRYPWFTASIVLFALQLMADMLLSGRLAMIPFSETLLTLSDLSAIVGLMVLVEVAWQAFAQAPRALWIANTLGLLVVAVCILKVWGPWPVWKNMALDTVLGKLRLMELAAQKGNMLAYLLVVGLMALVVLFGRQFKAGWRSHTQMIAIGLSTTAISSLAMQGTMQHIVKTVHPATRAEYEHILDLLGKLANANKAIYAAVLVWWIVWLWLDEPETVTRLQEETPQAVE